MAANMADPPSRPAQTKQPSRKGKKSWRKNIDLVELEAAQRTLTESDGRPPPELFVFDNLGAKHEGKETLKSSRALHEDRILGSSTTRDPIPARKRSCDHANISAITRVHKRLRRSDTQISKPETKSEVIAATEPLPRLYRAVVKSPNRDLWSTTSAAPPSTSDLSGQFLRIHQPSFPAHSPLTPAQVGETTRSLPADSESYNPTFDAWNAALAQRGEEAIKDEILRRKEAEYQDSLLARAAEATEDLRVELADEHETDSEADEDTTEGLGMKSRQPPRKSMARRRRVGRAKQLELKAEHRKLMKVQRARELNVKSIARAVRQEQAARQAAGKGTPNDKQYAITLLDSWERQHRRRS